MERDKVNPDYILITSMNFPSGGAGATYLNLFCRGIVSSGRSVKVLLLKGHAFGSFKYKGPRKSITENGIPYTYLGLTQRPDTPIKKLLEEVLSLIRLISYLVSLIGKHRPVRLLIFNSEVQYNIPILAFSKIFRFNVIKFVAEIIDPSEFTDSFFGRIKRVGYDYNYKVLNIKSDKLLVFSHYLKTFYHELGYDQSKIMVQPNLTDFDFWEPVNSNIRYTFGYSGAPYLKDGLHDLFKAISLLKREHPEITLLVIGDVTFGKSLIPSLKAECEVLWISENVSFTGLVELAMVKKYLAECGILAITRPSTLQTKAGFPTKLGEYFATKRPVLSTDFGDMKEYFTDEKDIIMAECGNAESIAEKIKWMIVNKQKLELISQQGYLKACQLLEYKNSVKRMMRFIES